MVTAVKYRKALLNSGVAECIKETLKGISQRYEIFIDEVGFDYCFIIREPPVLWILFVNISV